MATALEIRSLPLIWPGSTIAIIGGGPSVAQVNLDVLFKFRTIGVNHAFRLGPVDLCWFGDFGWYETNKNDLAKFAGLKATCCTQLPEENWPGIKRLRRSRKQFGIESERSDAVAWNHNSGASAINAAYHLGAKRVLLVGFDMKRVAGRTHYHNFYGPTPKEKKTYDRHLKGFDQIAIDAMLLGLEIINCTPGSAITQFPFMPLEKV